MLNISSRISVIRLLLEEGSDCALAYAALESRLTIEQVCYERLRMSYGHISYEDLRQWQPRHVVKQVIEDANEQAASSFKISISKNPVESTRDLTEKEFSAMEYIQIGQQAGFKPNRLGSLWNALSNIGLHVKLPERKDDPIAPYASSGELKKKVLETLKELEKLKDGTLLAGAIGTNYFFRCVSCTTEIRRIERLLKHGQIINCINPRCPETYLISREKGETRHCRRVAQLICQQCEAKHEFPLSRLDELRFGKSCEIGCDSCGQKHEVRLKPQAKQV